MSCGPRLFARCPPRRVFGYRFGGRAVRSRNKEHRLHTTEHPDHRVSARSLDISGCLTCTKVWLRRAKKRRNPDSLGPIYYANLRQTDTCRVDETNKFALPLK
jgi:hypothetical protein